MSELIAGVPNVLYNYPRLIKVSMQYSFSMIKCYYFSSLRSNIDNKCLIDGQHLSELESLFCEDPHLVD